MKYRLEATLTIIHDDSNTQKHYYALSYAVNKLREVGQNATIYDKELKMYFKDKSAIATLFEVEIDHVYLNLDKSLSKATDFTRRTFYRYDWTHLQVSRQGKVLAIENEKDLIEQWKEIRELLFADYSGRQVSDSVERVDSQMNSGNFRKTPLACYFYFGLPFPAIPTKHASEWQQSRTIKLSDFDDVQFDERIKYEQTTDSQLREYSITGELIDTESCELKKYSGHITVPCNDIHPMEAQVEVSYDNGDMNVNWEFNLTKYQ